MYSLVYKLHKKADDWGSIPSMPNSDFQHIQRHVRLSQTPEQKAKLKNGYQFLYDTVRSVVEGTAKAGADVYRDAKNPLFWRGFNQYLLGDGTWRGAVKAGSRNFNNAKNSVFNTNPILGAANVGRLLWNGAVMAPATIGGLIRGAAGGEYAPLYDYTKAQRSKPFTWNLP